MTPLLILCRLPPPNRFHRWGTLTSRITNSSQNWAGEAREWSIARVIASLGRVVALKTIPPAHLAAPSARARFLLEASVAARLDHPNIVPIYEVGERDGFSFFSMKLVEGITLQQLFPEGPPREFGLPPELPLI